MERPEYKAKLKKPYKDHQIGSWYKFSILELNQELRECLDPDIFCLSTGFRCEDKQGHTIPLYTGDLVIFNYGNKTNVCLVDFSNGCFGITPKSLDGFDYDELLEDGSVKSSDFIYVDHFITFLELYWNYNMEFDQTFSMLTYIGNIFDNKEIWYGEKGCN